MCTGGPVIERNGASSKTVGKSAVMEAFRMVTSESGSAAVEDGAGGSAKWWLGRSAECCRLESRVEPAIDATNVRTFEHYSFEILTNELFLRMNVR